MGAIRCLGKGTSVRGESLALEDFARLSNFLAKTRSQIEN